MAFPDDDPKEAQDALFDEFGTTQAPVDLADLATPELAAPHPAEVRLAETEHELKELRDWATRVAADFENYKKRVERERQEQWRFSTERLLKDFLPVLDNLQRALAAARHVGEHTAISAGVELVIGEFLKVLKRAGVDPVDAEGHPFDPAFHEALQQVESDAGEPGSVLQVVQPGYTLHGRVLRPALVTVCAAPEVTSPGKSLDETES
jgi:molecular chaperone GrpE